MSVLDGTTLADLLPAHERPHLLSRLPGPSQMQQVQQPLAKSA